MSGKDLLVLTSLCWCIFHGCQSQDCTYYGLSDIPNDCVELEIENGHACYTKVLNTYFGYKLKATITCLDGFNQNGPSTRECTRSFKITDLAYVWTWDDRIPFCGPDSTTGKTLSTRSTTTTKTSTLAISLSADATTQETNGKAIIPAGEHKRDSFLGVYIAVPLVALGLVIGGLSLWFMYRRRRNASSAGLSRKRDLTSTMTNKTYDVPTNNEECIHAASVEDNSSEYVEIPDSSDQKTTVSEYNTLHTDGRTYSSAEYNHIPVQCDTYDHTMSTVIKAKRESETYSHINDAKHDKTRPALNNTGNTYNGLQVDGMCIEMNEFDSASVDPYYDHTNTRSDGPANIELETYAHVNNDLDVEDYVNSQEYHDYFVLEKTE